MIVTCELCGMVGNLTSPLTIDKGHVYCLRCHMAVKQNADQADAPDLSKDAPPVINATGGKQSDTNCRLDLIDADALLSLGATLDAGAKKYGENNWRNIDVNSHLNHALVHAYAYLSGDKQDDHLAHFFCRAMMAVAIHLNERE